MIYIFKDFVDLNIALIIVFKYCFLIFNSLGIPIVKCDDVTSTIHPSLFFQRKTTKTDIRNRTINRKSLDRS